MINSKIPFFAIFMFAFAGRISFAQIATPRTESSSDKSVWKTEEVQAPRLAFQVFSSQLAGCDVSFHVYTPPHYDQDTSTRFPVLYWLHGTEGGVGGIRPIGRMFHQAIADGVIPPLLLVFVNGLPNHLWTDSKDGARPVERVFVEELIPYVDKTMRTIANREGRILEGFSMGGYGAARIGFKHTDLFGRVSILAAGPLDLDFEGPRATGNPLRTEILKRVCSQDMDYFRETHPRTIAERQAGELTKTGQTVRVAVGTKDFSAHLTKSFHEHLDKLHIRHEFCEVLDADHDALALFNSLKSKSDFYRMSPKSDLSNQSVPEYSICRTWQEVVSGESFHYAPIIRVSNPGTKEQPAYTGFWFYDGLQFDPTGRYALAMKVHFQNRDVTAEDQGEIGYFDRHNNNQWIKIGVTRAWNWQQGCRLTWRGDSNEVLWNDLADDGTHFVCRAFDFKTRTVRTLPRAIYDVSRDGAFALTHNFERMRHGKSTNYVGIHDRYEDRFAPSEIGVEKMDMNTGQVEFLISLERISQIAFPDGYTGKTNLYFFREGWNPSGSRFITFLKNADRPTYTGGWSISADGRDVRFFYMTPSHHVWLDDETILDGRHFSIYKDNGSGKPQTIADVGSVDFDPTVLPGDQWFVLDTYPLEGWQHVVLFHRPTNQFVPLAKLKNTAPDGDYRVDIHARATRDGRTICIDSSHDGLGRQMYLIPIGHILDHPPSAKNGVLLRK